MQLLDDKIKNASDKSLAGYVVAYRLLGIYKELSVKCMEELMLRRLNGSNFDFEEYIENELKDVPKPTDLTKITGILKGLI